MNYTVRIVDIDFYMSAPIEGFDVTYSKFRGAAINQVPILRLFGCTPEGQKICVHIHGVFPYLYIPYDGTQEANSLMYQIATLIDKSINVSLNQTSSNVQHVYKISLVSGIPMYGYHTRPHQFFKICLYNPILIKKLSNLLQNESTLGQLYQPHETHLNFTLQFMIDYNLHGMSFMNLSEIKFRRNLNQKNNGISDDLFLPLSVKKTTVCELEADVMAYHITNREQVTSGHIAANPGIECLWEDERQRKQNKGDNTELKHLLELTRTDVEPTKTHLFFKQVLKERLAAFSTDKNIVNKLNSSVYPAETPENLQVQPASDNDSDITSSLELSLDDTVCDLDATMTSDLSMREDDAELFSILNKLGNSNDDLEDDSILTQVVKAMEEEVDLDMTLPLEKTIAKMEHDSEDEFDKTLIPQLDGAYDDYTKVSKKRNKAPKSSSLSSGKQPRKKVNKEDSKYVKKTLYIKLVRDSFLDDLIDTKVALNIIGNYGDSSCSLCEKTKRKKSGKTKKPFKRKLNVEKQTSRDLRSLSHNIKKINKRKHIMSIMKKLHNNENLIKIHLNKCGYPDFRIISKSNIKAPYQTESSNPREKYSNVNTLTQIILNTSAYTEPTLHMTIKYPDDQLFLYTYNDIYPDVTNLPKVPGELCQHQKDEYLSKIVKDSYNYSDYLMLTYKKEEIKEDMDSDIIDSYSMRNDEFDPNSQGTIKEEPKTYLDSMEYLSQVNNESLVDEIKHHTVKERQLTIENIRKQLSQHIKNIEMSFYKSNVNTETEDNNGNNNVENLPTVNITCRETNDGILAEDTDSNSTVSPRKLYNLRLRQERKDNESKKLKLTNEVKPRQGNKQKNLAPLFVDGACDSSSENEDFIPKTPPLPAGKVMLRRKKRKLIETFHADEESSLNISTNTSVTDYGPKTKIKIENIPANITIVEEKMACAFRSSTPFKKSGLQNNTLGLEMKLKSEPHSNFEQICPITDLHNTSFPQIVPGKSTTDLPLTGDKASNKSLVKISSQKDDILSSYINTQTVACKNTEVDEENLVENSSPDVEEMISSNNSNNDKNGQGISIENIESNSFVDHDTIEAKPCCSKSSEMTVEHSIKDLVVKPGSSKSSEATFKDLVMKPSSSKSSEATFKQEPLTYSKIEDIGVVRHPFLINKPSKIIMKPIRKAPTKEEVFNSLNKYGIPHVKPQEPFYSNIQDVGASIKVGHQVLKVNGLNPSCLPEYESQTDPINSFRRKVIKSMSFVVPDTKEAFKNLALSFCKFDSCIVKPVRKPPTPAEVKKWLKSNHKSKIEASKKSEVKTKPKLHVPLTLGGKNDEDMDVSLSLSLSEPPESQKMDENQSGSSILSQNSDGVDKDNINININKLQSSTSSYDSCLISGVTVNDTYNFRQPTGDFKVRAFVEHQYITIMVMEVHVLTRGDLKPDPLQDPIQAIFYSILNDVPEANTKPRRFKGALVVNPIEPDQSDCDNKVLLLDGLGMACDIIYVDTEENLFKEFTNIMNCWDPDIVAGYEIEMLSWGYLIERGAALNINIKHSLGRNCLEEPKRRFDDNLRELKIIGRIVLDVWRLMRHEIAAQSYTFESVVYHILHKRTPCYAFKTLTHWWNHHTNLYRHRVVKYYLIRVDTVLELFDKLDFINRTSELARLFGILFYEVLSRGSQFRVESMMLRLAKPLNFIPVSPSTQQRAHMKAPEYIALVLEPESKLYNDPVIVLDFQSLYPSIIIAYNYCFTTCIGRVKCLGKNGPFEFGATQLKVSRKRLEKLLERDLLNFSPCGVGFVKKEVRDGIMPRMLREILDTRLMVKNSMKENKDDHNLQKVLHNRQLGLKLIANVTYGYTAANFSGRMPSVEVGDSVVSKGRETLQRAIEMVENTPEWGAKVVYGDTDSLFVMVPGRSREYAFEVGAKIAEAVTKANPDPMKLKLEKVYQPCILQTKKRYVGYMYESPDQKEPVYEAKGIETVRRDGIPATTKMLEKCLRILFETKDVSLVKKYVVKQFSKILAGRASIQDLTFAKEYRGAAGYQPGACVPALELAKKWRAVDKRAEPRSAERVPYVIVHGPPDVPLIRLVRSPRDLLNDCFLTPHAIYYITKAIIPPINRCFNLIGVDLFTWFNEMQRKKSHYLIGPTSPEKKSTINQYFTTTSCVVCGVHTQTRICQRCSSSKHLQNTTITLIEKLKGWEQNYHNCIRICQSCTLCQDDICCVSLDCPVLYRRVQTNHDLKQESYVRDIIPPEMLF